jgi:hypothetical protein
MSKISGKESQLVACNKEIDNIDLTEITNTKRYRLGRYRQFASRLIGALLFAVALVLIAQMISARATAAFPFAASAGAEPLLNREMETAIERNDGRAREAFLSVIPVLEHPRCLNCHSAGDYPRQGDDRHIHAQNVKRGTDGRGRYGQRCSACHQDYNVAGLNMPPGATNWHLPPRKMPMIWEDKTPGQICQQIKDPKQNGGKTIPQIVEHVTSDKLVMWGWSPGEGRTPPTMGHGQFAQKMADWARYGCACPEP